MDQWVEFCLFVLSECIGVGWSRLSGPQNILHFLHGEVWTRKLHFLQHCSINTVTAYTVIHCFVHRQRNQWERTTASSVTPVWRSRTITPSGPTAASVRQIVESNKCSENTITCGTVEYVKLLSSLRAHTSTEVEQSSKCVILVHRVTAFHLHQNK